MFIHTCHLLLIGWRMNSSAEVLVKEVTHPLGSPIILLLLVLAVGLIGLVVCYVSDFSEYS